VEIETDEGFRAAEPAGSRRAAFCRLEHVVPWVLSGPRWEPGDLDEIDPGEALGLGRCAHCGAGPLDDTAVVAVRHRGPHRIADAFCDADHLLDWAKAGGRFRVT